MIDTLSTEEFWKIVEEAFIHLRNITFDRHVFLITKQLYGKLKKLAEKCDFENKEETLIRDVFINNLIDPEIRKEILKQTVEPRQALELKINMELGMRKTLIPASVDAIQFPMNSRTPNWSNSNTLQRQNNRSTLHCLNCGVVWLPNDPD